MKILSEFYDFWKERKEKTTLDHKYQIFQICVRRKKRGWLQHRIQLGILLPCEARRTADQVPKNWVYGVIVKKDRQKGGKKLLFDHSEIL